jgi:GNAT superfamily N-acetyltransferase
VTSSRPDLLQLFDQQIRRNSTLNGSGSVASVGPTYLRWAASNGVGWSEVMWTSLTDATVDDAIAQHVEFYRSQHVSFIWSVYDYDRPPDLGARLELAGFALIGTSAVMIAEVLDVAGEPKLPPGVSLHQIRDAPEVDLLIRVHESVFGHSQQDLRRALLHRLEVAPNEIEMFVVLTDSGEPVSSSRVEYLPASSFAALWGGSTEPEWRGQGLYRAQTMHRAQLARERGYRYLMVLASAHSQPILSAMGFEKVASVTRYSSPQ